jgi:hypothetical protein
MANKECRKAGNVDLNEPRSLINAYRLNHLNITASPAVQDLVVARILEVVRAASEP